MKFRSGVLHGEEVTELLNYANENNFALPAVNVVNTSSVNAVLQTAKDLNSPVIIITIRPTTKNTIYILRNIHIASLKLSSSPKNEIVSF